MKLPRNSKVRAFELHGVEFEGESTSQYYGRCPFSGKSGKFYVNKETLLWDSKITDLNGNLYKFLEAIAELNAGNGLEKLSRNRGLPKEAFHFWGIGYGAGKYTIPVRNEKGTVIDLRYWRPKIHGVWTTKGCKPGLLGAERLVKAHPNKPVYICEGEWDVVALQYLLQICKKGGIVVGLPGAKTFRKEWVEWFENRDVFLCYDNDKAGAEGELKAFRLLHDRTRTLHYLRFPEETTEGYDVRDWVVEWLSKKKPKTGLREFTKLFVGEPRLSEEAEDESDTRTKSAYTKPASFKEVEKVFKKWLHLSDTDGIRVALATVLSNRLDGDPIWMFFVAPPGGSKTATLSAFTRCRKTYITSSITSRSLISGFHFRNGVDPSLIPKLAGKVLIIKDFTCILEMRDNEKDEIFGILRDAYDGSCGKVFGNGIVRRYNSRFSILAAVTPSIYSEGSKNASLGERFLKFCVSDNLRHFSEDAIIEKAISNVNTETAMRSEMEDVVQSFMQRKTNSKPEIPSEILASIISLAKLGARARASIQRDRFRPDMVEGRPSAEVGSRLGKQLAKLSMSLAFVDGRNKVNEADLRIVKKVVIDTVPQRVEDIIRFMWKKCPHEDDTIKTRDIVFGTRYPTATISRLLA
ncbi:MAG: toprim domain-containing protein, partial [Candidatus Kariarchaeaceae archaeon]